MASSEKNLSSHSNKNIKDISKRKFGILVSEWNDEVTDSLLSGCIEVLLKSGSAKDNITINYVPGSFELPLAAQKFAFTKDFDAIICLGCIIHGETRHFEFICNAVANGIMRVGLDNNLPVIFGVLTTENKKQALDRAGGKHGNKGEEAAISAIKMLGI